MSSIESNPQAVFEGQVNSEYIDYNEDLNDLLGLNRLSCWYIAATFCNWGGEEHLAGGNCTEAFMYPGSQKVCVGSSEYQPERDNSLGGGGGGGETSSIPSTNPKVVEPCEISSNGSNGNNINLTENSCDNEGNVINIDVLINIKNQIEQCLGNEYNDVWFDNASFNDISNISNYLDDNCTDETKAFLELAIENNLDIKAVVSLLEEMDRTCQRNILFHSIVKVNSTFTNMIKTTYLISQDNDINLSDISVGEGDPPMLSITPARTNPNPNINSETNADVITIEFNNSYLDQATNLGLVISLYHELIHAHIFHLYNDGNLLTEHPNYTTLKTALDNWFANPSDDTIEEIAQQELHNIYVDFIDDLADSVHKYCLENNILGVDLEYAKTLVWGSLNGYDVFTDIDNLSPTQQIEAQTNLAYENFNDTENAKSSKTCD